jgi:hypothetical protein
MDLHTQKSVGNSSNINFKNQVPSVAAFVRACPHQEQCPAFALDLACWSVRISMTTEKEMGGCSLNQSILSYRL